MSMKKKDKSLVRQVGRLINIPRQIDEQILGRSVIQNEGMMDCNDKRWNEGNQNESGIKRE